MAVDGNRKRSANVGHHLDGELVTYTDGTTGFRQYTAFTGTQLDAFGRVRSSGPGNRLDCEFIYDLQPDLFDAFTTNGAVTHNATTRDVTLSLSASAEGNHATMSSYPVPYTPGCSQLPELTGVLDLANIGTGHVEVFLRSSVTGSVVEETITQANWDTFTDDRNWQYSHIFAIDFQSLKVGTIRYCMVSQGVTTCVAKIHNDNVRNSGYWQQPTLPVQYRLYIEDKGDGVKTYREIAYGNSANAIGFRYVIDGANASATMKAVCCTVKSEGGKALDDMRGLPRNASTDATTISVTSATVIQPIISIRVKSTFKSLPNLGLTMPDHFSIYSNQDVRAILILGGTLTGASWVDVDTTYSHTEKDISATAITGGRIIHNDFFGAASGANNFSSADGVLGKAPLWNRLDGETGILTLAAVHLGTNATVRGDIGFEEIR